LNDHHQLSAELDAIRSAARRLTDPGAEPAPGGDPPADGSSGPDAAGDAAPPPEVTVAMPARNAAPYIAEAIGSVLRQEGVALELVVVDDASTDATAEIVGAIRDPRVRLLRNDRRRGIGHGHNRALEAAHAPLIAHVDADDVILQGALAAMVEALRAEPEAGQAYCNHYALDADGHIEAEDFRRQRAFLEAQRREHPAYRRGLLRHGMVTNTLRTYRRDVLRDAGPFDEGLRFAVDYEMALRIADRYPMTLVPRFLYAQRLHAGNTQETMRLRALRSWCQRRRIAERLLRERDGRLLGYGRVEVRLLMVGGLADALGLGHLRGALRALLRERSGRARRRGRKGPGVSAKTSDRGSSRSEESPAHPDRCGRRSR